MVVCKFGGSSVATAAQMRKVKAIVESERERRIIVVSAPGKRSKDDTKVTDLLYKCSDAVRMGCSSREIFADVEKRYLDILSGLGMDAGAFRKVLDEVREKIDAGYGPDFASSRGEYLNARLVATYLGWTFLDTEGLVIVRNDGTVDPSTYDRIASRVEEGALYVVPGFYGSDTEGRVKTFTRGGSDITGSIFARACGAEKYENWTDVSGIYAANPLVVPTARVTPVMTYREAREFSDLGASVFHEEAIAPVLGTEVVINVRNTERSGEPGTMIVPSREGDDLIGVSARKGYSRLAVRKLMLFKRRGIRHALLTMMQVFGIRPSFSMCGVDSVSWFFETRLASEGVVESLCERLRKEFALGRATVEGGHAIVGVVGQGIAGHSEYVGIASGALSAAKIPVNFINYGSSEVSMLIGVPEEMADEAQRVLYKALFQGDER